MQITDDYINKLFEGTDFGGVVDRSVDSKRQFIAKKLRHQLQGCWTGHTAYHLMVYGGFLIDSSRYHKKQLTLLGSVFMRSMEEPHE